MNAGKLDENTFKEDAIKSLGWGFIMVLIGPLFIFTGGLRIGSIDLAYLIILIGFAYMLYGVNKFRQYQLLKNE